MTRRFACVSVPLVSALLLVPVTAHAQTRSVGAISGTVVTIGGVPVADATVRLLSDTPTGFVADAQVTDSKGHYGFTDVPQGDYELRVDADGCNRFVGQLTVVADVDLVYSPRVTQREFFFQWGPNRGIDLTLIQVGSYVFFDNGTDDEGEIDLYQDGKASISLQLAGIDFVAYRSPTTGARFGVNTGMALIGSSQTVTGSATDAAKSESDYGSVFVWSASLFVDLAKIVRLEAGHVMGISAKESLTRGQANDSAWFIGLSVKSSLGDFVKKIR